MSIALDKIIVSSVPEEKLPKVQITHDRIIINDMNIVPTDEKEPYPYVFKRKKMPRGSQIVGINSCQLRAHMKQILPFLKIFEILYFIKKGAFKRYFLLKYRPNKKCFIPIPGSIVHEDIQNDLESDQIEAPIRVPPTIFRLIKKEITNPRKPLSFLKKIQKCIINYREFKNDFRPIPIIIEKPSISFTIEFGGTVDLLCLISFSPVMIDKLKEFNRYNRYIDWTDIIPNKKYLILLDWKSGSHLFPNHRDQTSGYRFHWQYEKNILDKIKTIHGKEIEWFPYNAVVLLGGDNYNFQLTENHISYFIKDYIKYLFSSPIPTENRSCNFCFVNNSCYK
ncbi:MAG: hypothetical protein EAX96_06420 [Candidatus Lokiarchaeota archaeon]|nr:hypothetical protein [Candidatus Lokiarchaeota archaeon]